MLRWQVAGRDKSPKHRLTAEEASATEWSAERKTAHDGDSWAAVEAESDEESMRIVKKSRREVDSRERQIVLKLGEKNRNHV